MRVLFVRMFAERTETGKRQDAGWITGPADTQRGT